MSRCSLGPSYGYRSREGFCHRRKLKQRSSPVSTTSNWISSPVTSGVTQDSSGEMVTSVDGGTVVRARPVMLNYGGTECPNCNPKPVYHKVPTAIQPEYWGFGSGRNNCFLMLSCWGHLAHVPPGIIITNRFMWGTNYIQGNEKNRLKGKPAFSIEQILLK